MVNIIEQYYQGITQQLRAEVNFINSLFQHQGVKGEGNEVLLRELIAKFIPKRYGVSTGIVIDRYGNQSRQCDIIIYDTFLYPSLLSLSTVHLFPVDIVYATVEVKTTFNSQSAKEALTNIASVKSLKIITDNFMVPESRGGNVELINYSPRSPMGFVFGYNSDALQFQTFKNWFTPTSKNETQEFPILVGCLDQGIVLFKEVYPLKGMLPEGWLMPLMSPAVDGRPTPTTLSRQIDYYAHESMIYPVKSFNENYIVIDQSKTLLLFILTLNEMLSQKRINPEISFINTYVPSDVGFHFVL